MSINSEQIFWEYIWPLFYARTQSFTEKIFFWFVYKKNLVKTYFGAPEIVFFTQAPKKCHIFVTLCVRTYIMSICSHKFIF